MRKYLLVSVFSAGCSLLVYNSFPGSGNNSSNELVKICHCSGMPETGCETMGLSRAEVQEHLAHGDAAGGCLEVSSASLLPVN